MTRTLAYIVLTLALVAAGVIVWFFQREPLATGQPIAVSPEVVTTEVVSQPVISTTEEVVSYLFPGEQGGLAQFSIKENKIVQSYVMPGISSVVWSQDGRNAVAWVYQDKELLRQLKSPFLLEDAQEGQPTVWLIDMENGRPERLSDYIQAVTWDASHKVMYYYYQDFVTSAEGISDLRRMDVRTDKEEILGAIPAAAAYELEFLDEHTVLVIPQATDVEGTTGIYLFSATTKELQRFKENETTVVKGWKGGESILYASTARRPSWHIYNWKTNADEDLELLSDDSYAFWIGPQRFIIGSTTANGTDSWILIDLSTRSRHQIEVATDAPFNISSAQAAADGTLYFTSNETLYRVTIP